MGLVRLDHANVQTEHLEALVDFYEGTLGLKVGPRPNFSFAGAWLYCGEQAIVHLVQTNKPLIDASRSQRLEHFALAASGLAEFLKRLESRGVEPRLSPLVDVQLFQVHLTDPDGNHLHIDFPLAEAKELGLV